MTDFEAIAKGLTQAVPFAGHLGLEITSVGEGEAVVVLPERPELANHVGSQHAGGLFTAAETASGAAFVGAFAERHRGSDAARPQRRDLLRKAGQGPDQASARLGVAKEEALATLDAEGKVVFPCAIELTDSDGQQVASATVDWHVRLNQPPSS